MLADGRAARLLHALESVRSAGTTMQPRWDAHSRVGFSYGNGTSALDAAALCETLEELADQEYLERIFTERLSLCAQCGSHAVNVHEACLSCSSSNLVQFKALFHFRCGFVGPVSAFRPEPQGRRCPKCAKILADLGTDHDSPGDFFRCRSCAASFQDPEVAARCLACGAQFAGSQMQAMRYRDVFAYRLTTLGAAALREGRLLESPIEALQASGTLARRDTMVDRLETERRTRMASGKSFGVVVVKAPQAASSELVEALRGELTPPYELGRLGPGHILILLPGLAGARVESVRERMAALQTGAGARVRAEIVRIEDGDDIQDVLDFALGAMAGDG
jgi:hypothetical protein